MPKIKKPTKRQFEIGEAFKAGDTIAVISIDARHVKNHYFATKNEIESAIRAVMLWQERGKDV